MDFTFDEDQTQLRAAVKGYLERRNPFEARTRASRTDKGLNEALWRGLADDLGILGAAVPENAGGLGRSAIDLMVVMEEAGANLLVEPYLEAAVIAPSLLARAAGQEAELAAVAAGDARPVLAWGEPGGRYSDVARKTVATPERDGWRLNGTKAVVTGAPWATSLLVTASTPEGQRLFRVAPDAPGVALVAYPTIDGRRAADITFTDVKLDSAAQILGAEAAQDAVAKALDLGAAMTGARALGVMRELFDQTVDYARQRRQFGKAIAEFQVLQHRMVDMYMHLELATSAVYRAVLMLDAPSAEREMTVSAMKVTVGEACRFVGQNAIQLHGGMGMTDEMPVSHYFRAATVIETEYGSTDFHLARFARLSQKAGA